MVRCLRGGQAFTVVNCNQKIVGARFFSKGYEATIEALNETAEFHSLLNFDGHGSHTASTAAGRAIIRPTTKIKSLDIMIENAQNYLGSCKLEVTTKDTVKKLMPDVIMPLNVAFYMSEAVNIHPLRYLQALFLACQNLSGNFMISENPSKGISFDKKAIDNLQELSASDA